MVKKFYRQNRKKVKKKDTFESVAAVLIKSLNLEDPERIIPAPRPEEQTSSKGQPTFRSTKEQSHINKTLRLTLKNSVYWLYLDYQNRYPMKCPHSGENNFQLPL